MDREKLTDLLERIEGNAWMVKRFLNDPNVGSAEAAIEIVGRMGIIEAKVAEIRKELLSDVSGRPDNDNVHVLGNRGDAA